MGTRSDNTVTCTPHFKSDAEQPWVVQEGVGVISLWMHPDSNMTLEDVAALIESFASSQVDQRMINYSGRIHNATFRGQTIVREQMSARLARDYVRDGEPFNLRFIFGASPKLWLIFCPCFICCMGGPSPNNAVSPTSQKDSNIL